MAWALDTKRSRIWLKEKQTFGRADFPKHKSLSREHIEVTVRKGSVFVKDLGSSNGTSINGHKLAANMSSSLLDGDMVKIGGVELTLKFVKERYFQREDVTRAAMFASFFVAFLVYCARPSVDFGLALMPWPLLVMGFIFGASAVVSGVAWSLILKNRAWNLKLCRGFFAAVLASTAAFASIVLWSIEPDIPLAQWIDSNRLEYFCVDSFDSNHCRQTVAECPDCAKHLIRWKQDIMLKHLNLEREIFERELSVETRIPASQ